MQIKTFFILGFMLGIVEGTKSRWYTQCPEVCKCQSYFWKELKIDAKTIYCINQTLVQIPKNLSQEAEVLVLRHNTLGFSYHLNIIDLFHLRRLLMLDLSLNKFKSLRNTGGTIDSVAYLNFSHNCLQRLEPGMFRNFPNIKHLDLSSNRIVFIAPLALELSTLETLDLSYNRLTALQSRYFTGLRNIRVLLLKSNNIGKIYEPILHHLGKIDLLDLSENRINKLDAKSFTYVESIYRLDLSQNQFHRIPTEALSQLNHVRFLNLGRNPYKLLQANSFSGINVAEILLLENPQLALIEKHAFANISVKSIFIRDNRNLLYIDNFAFSNLFSLKKIDLRNNRLLTLSDDVFHLTPFLNEFLLTGNSFDCTCTLKWLQHLIQRNHSRIRVKDATKITCRETNGALRNLKLLQPLPSLCQPKILPLFPEKVEKLPGSNFSVLCLAVGFPLPKTKWTSKNGSQIFCDGGRSCVKENRLSVRYVQNADEGSYTCEAFNPLGIDQREVELSVREMNIYMMALAIAPTFVTLSWNFTSHGEYVLQYEQLTPLKGNLKTRSIPSGRLKGHSYTLSGLHPGATYAVWLGLRRGRDVVIRLSYVEITTRDEAFLIMLGFQTNYFSIGVFATAVGGVVLSCCAVCTFPRLCRRFRTRRHREMILVESQRCFSNSLAFITFVNDEENLMADDENGD